MVALKYSFFVLVILFSFKSYAQNKSVPIIICQEKNGKEITVYAFFNKTANGEKSLLTTITSKKYSIGSNRSVADSNEVVVAVAVVVRSKSGFRVTKKTVGSINKYLKLPCVSDALLRKFKSKKSYSI